MNPIQLAKANKEHSHQRAFFAWCNMAFRYGYDVAQDMEAYTNTNYYKELGRGDPRLEWIHAIPNGGLRNKATASNLKAEGVKSGVLDVFLPHNCSIYL